VQAYRIQLIQLRAPLNFSATDVVWNAKVLITILAIVCIGILLLEFLVIFILDKIDKTEYISEGIAMGIAFLVCIQ